MSLRQTEIKELSTSLYEVLAEDAGWRHSPAHDGWISDDYKDDWAKEGDGYESFETAEEIAFCCDVTGGDEAGKLAAAAERNAKLLDDALAALKAVRSFYGKPEHANTEGQRKAMVEVVSILDRAKGQP